MLFKSLKPEIFDEMCHKNLSDGPVAIAYMSDFFYVCQVRLVAKL